MPLGSVRGRPYRDGTRVGDASRIEGKSIEDLLGQLTDSEPGSVAHEQVKAAIEVRIAEIQREAAGDSLRWAMLTAFAESLATVIALVALLVAALQ
jgi:hypothetical protein